LLGIALLCVSSGNGNAQNTAPPSSAKQHMLYLDRSNSGQALSVTVGQPIQITLQTIGGGQYVSPQISSPAIRFESAAFAERPNPGGPKQIYRFRAASEGEAQIFIPHEAKGTVTTPDGVESPYKDITPPFAVTIRVHGQRTP
jgi:hypothetical protein